MLAVTNHLFVLHVSVNGFHEDLLHNFARAYGETDNSNALSGLF